MTSTLAFILVALPVAAAGAGCPPAAHLDGARHLVGAVTRLLRAHGVAVDHAAPAACSDTAVRVSIQAPPRGAPLTLHIQDRFGRASEREVADVATAASLIETWALQEDRALLTPPVRTTAPTVVAAPDEVAPAAATWALLASVEAAAASDGSVWYGPTLGACGRVGRLCVGARARLARDSGVGGPPDDHVFTRTDIDALATVATTITHGRLTFTPTVGIGAGRVWSSRPPVGANAISATSDGPRGEAGAIAALTVSRHWSIFLEGNAMLARLGAAEGAPSPLTSPTAFYRAGLGCRVTP